MKRIRISKPGYSISTSDLNNIVYDSQYDTLKYHASGHAQLAVSGANAETTITHGLGYVPVFVAYYKNPALTARHSMLPFALQDVGFYLFLSAYADNDKIYITCHTNAATLTWDVYYKIFRNDTGL